MRQTFLALLLFCAGCGCNHPPTRIEPDPKPILINLCPKDFDSYSVQCWTLQAQRRFGPAIVLLFCHGAGSPWHITPQTGAPRLDVDTVAWTLHSEYPTRRLVVLACNTEAQTLSVPNCAYAKHSIWIMPGMDWRYDWPSNEVIYGVGGIDEFVLTPER